MKREELTKDIIGAAMAVLNELKPGLDEKFTRTHWSSNWSSVAKAWRNAE